MKKKYKRDSTDQNLELPGRGGPRGWIRKRKP